MSDTTIPVIATQVGFFGGQRRAVGSKFSLTDEAQFSESWMKPVDPEWKPAKQVEAEEQAKAAEDAKLKQIADLESALTAKTDEIAKLQEANKALEAKVTELEEAATKPQEGKKAK